MRELWSVNGRRVIILLWVAVALAFSCDEGAVTVYLDSGIGEDEVAGGDAGLELAGWPDAGDLGLTGDKEGPAGSLKILSVSPNYGPVDGETLAVIKGMGFAEGVRVYFGPDEAFNVAVVSANVITCTVPAGEVGKVDLELLRADGAVAILEEAFTYLEEQQEFLTLKSIVPEMGPETGGFMCMLTGTGFYPGISVRLGENVVENVNVLSDTALTFVASPGPPGVVDVIV